MVLSLVLIVGLNCDVAFRQIRDQQLSNVPTWQLAIPRPQRIEYIDPNDGRVKNHRLTLKDKWELLRKGAVSRGPFDIRRNLILNVGTHDATELEVLWKVSNFILNTQKQIGALMHAYLAQSDGSQSFQKQVLDFVSGLSPETLGHAHAFLKTEYDQLVSSLIHLMNLTTPSLVAAMHSGSREAENDLVRLWEDLEALASHGVEDRTIIERRLAPEAVLQLPLHRLFDFYHKYTQVQVGYFRANSVKLFTSDERLAQYEDRVRSFLKKPVVQDLKDLRTQSPQLYPAAKAQLIRHIESDLKLRGPFAFQDSDDEVSVLHPLEHMDKAFKLVDQVIDQLRTISAELNDPDLLPENLDLLPWMKDPRKK